MTMLQAGSYANFVVDNHAALVYSLLGPLFYGFYVLVFLLESSWRSLCGSRIQRRRF